MRYGNKSVVSKVRPVEEMPFTESGKRVHLLLNLLAIINRTTSFAIYEIIISAICWQARDRMKTLKTYKEREKLMFDIVYDFNEIQYTEMKAAYEKLSEEEQHKVIDDAMNEGIYINISPVKETKPIFYRIIEILQKYDWLHPEKTYIMENGRKVLTLSKHWIGTMHIIKLKQSDLRGFSARSTGAVDIKGLPTRSYKSRNHMEKHSDSAIRFGEYETLGGFSIGVPTEDIALFHAVYRTSIKGREDIVKMAFDHDDSSDALRGKIDASYTSRVAEVFNVIFKSLGLEIDFVNENDVIRGIDSHELKMHVLNGETYLCTDYDFFLMNRREEIKEEILKEKLVMSGDELEKEIDRRMKCASYAMGSCYDEDGNLISY